MTAEVGSVAAVRARRAAGSPSETIRPTKKTPCAQTRKRLQESRVIGGDAITVERRGRRGPGCANEFVRSESLWATRLRRALPPWPSASVRALAQDAHGTAQRPAHRRHPRARAFASGPARKSPSVVFAVWMQLHIPRRCISLLAANSYAQERKLVPPPATPHRELPRASERS